MATNRRRTCGRWRAGGAGRRPPTAGDRTSSSHVRRLRPAHDVRARVLSGPDHRDHVPDPRRRLASRFPEIIPLAIKFPNLTGTISLRYAESLINWHQAYIRNQDAAGTKDGKAHRSGSIEFLTPDRKQTLFRINLEEVGPMHLTVAPAKANEEQIRRLQFELYVRRMSLEGSSLLGFV